MSISFKKTRLAPTPSGYLHLGNILSFVLTAGTARKYGAKILLRIDDIDEERVRKEYLDDIFDTLHFLEIPWDEGPRDKEDHCRHFAQKHRIYSYRQALNRLAAQNQVFACTCTRSSLEQAGLPSNYPGICLEKQIPLSEKNVQWRLKTDRNQSISMHDFQHNVISAGLPSTMDYFQVRNKNGNPSYQLSSMIDDILWGVDLIIRGEDLWDSSLAQLCLAQKLNEHSFLSACFLHHPLLKSDDNKKLSKSAGSTSIHFLRKSGMKKNKVYEMLASKVGSYALPQNWQELYEILVDKWVKQA